MYSSPFFEQVDENPRMEVQKLLSAVGWEGSLPIDLLDFCEKCDYEVRFESRPDLLGVVGRVQYLTSGDFYILINTHETDNLTGFSANNSLRRRQRFTLAHEIGHCTYKSHTDLELQANLQDKRNPHHLPYQKKLENQANDFACHLLIPESSYKQLERKWDGKSAKALVEEVAVTFDVSIQMAMQQIAKRASFAAIAILFTPKGVPLRVPVYSSDFQELSLYFGKDQPVPENTAAASLLDGALDSNSLVKRYKSLEPWFSTAYRWKIEKYRITETSILLGSYGVATLLEISDQGFN